MKLLILVPLLALAGCSTPKVWTKISEASVPAERSRVRQSDELSAQFKVVIEWKFKGIRRGEESYLLDSVGLGGAAELGSDSKITSAELVDRRSGREGSSTTSTELDWSRPLWVFHVSQDWAVGGDSGSIEKKVEIAPWLNRAYRDGDFVAIVTFHRKANQRPQGTPGKEPSSSTEPEARGP